METRLKALAEASARIFAACSLDDTLRLVTEAAREIVGAHQSVTSLTTDGKWAQAIVSVSLSDKYAAWRSFDAKPSGKGIYTRVCAENRPMRLTQAELEAHPAFEKFGAAKGRHPPLRGWLAAPLVGRDGVNLGLIQLSDKNAGEFDAGDEAVLVQLARLGALAVENQRLIEAAQAAERRFEAFATLGNEVLWETDAQHRYTLFLAKGSFRMRRKPESFIGITRWEATGADPADPFWAAHIADLEAHRPLRGFEFSAPLGDGKLHRLRINAEPLFDAAGRFTGYRGTTQDVTDLREAEAAAKANEARFHDFAKIGSDILWETDADHRYTEIAASQDSPVRPHIAAILGKTRWEYLGADLNDPAWQSHIADIAARRPFRNFEYVTRKHGGRESRLCVSGWPIFAADGAFRGYRGTTQDITDLRAAEAAARASEDRFRQFAEIASDWLWETDAEHRFTFFGGASGTLDQRPYGVTRWDLVGADLADPKWRAHRADLEAGRPFRDFEYTRIDQAGRTRHISVNGQPVRAPDGALVGYRGTASDITARREAEAEARKAAEQYRGIVETANEGVWILDKDARTTFVNARMADMMGYAPADLLGRSIYDFRPADDSDQGARRWSARQQGIAEQREARFIRRDGSIFLAHVSAAPMKDASGAFVGALGMVTDVTERKKAEAALKASEDRFRDFAEVGSDWLWETDAEHRVTLMDGPSPIAKDFALGRRLWEYGNVDPDAPEWRQHRRDLDLRLPFRNFTYKNRNSEGETRYFSISGKPVFAADGGFVGYRGTTRDITAKHEAEARLRASETRFKDFAAVASDWMWETDAQHRFSYFTPSRDQSQPDSSNAAIGRTRWDFAGADLDDPKWQAHLADLDAHRPFHHLEYQYRRPDGSAGTYVVSGVPVSGEDGAFVGYRGTTTDITAQRQAEAAARETERKFRRIVETANEGIWMLDGDRRTAYVNPRMAEMLGYTPEEMLGRHHWDFMAPADRVGAVEDTRKRPPGVVERQELRYMRKDGSPVWVLVTSNVIDDPAGGASGVLGMVSDITDRKRAEDAAAASEARFRDFAETGADWMWETDAQHRITFMSGAVLAVGHQPLGRTRWGLSNADADHPEWREQVAAMEERRPFRDCEFTVRDKDGNAHTLVSSGRPVFDSEGKFTGFRGVTSDRTRQREAEAAAAESEKKFRQFVETANEGVWMVDADLTVTYANPRLGELLGYAPSEIVGRPFVDFKYAEDHDAALTLWNERKHIGLDRLETRLRRRDGHSVWVLMSATPRFEADGRVAGAFVMIVDVTDRKAAEEQAARAKREVDATLASISDGFVAVDNEWRFTYVNAAAERIIGRSAAELLGRSAPDLVKGGGGNLFGESYRAAKRDHEPTFFTAYSDTLGLWLEVRAYPHADGLTIFFRDVTAERQSHRALVESERKFRQIVETASEGLWMTNDRAEIIFANRRVEELLGYEAGELIGKSVLDTIPEDRRELVRQHWGDRQKGKADRFEARHLRKDGSEITMLLSATPMVDGDGRFCGSFVMFVDISEQRRVQAALEESEHKLRAALENNQSILASISDGFVALDNEWRFTFINPAAERMWDKKADDLLGRTIFNSLQVDPNNPFHSNYLESKRSGEPVAFTALSEMFGKWLEVRGYPHAGGYTLFFDDVTEQRSAHRALIVSQKKLQAAREMNERIFETSLDLICITDRNGDFLQVNPGACQQFGYPEEELVGHNASEFIHDDGIETTRQALRDARTSRSLHTFENRCRRKSGQFVPMNWSVAWSEREQKYFLIGRDMSERMEAQERLNRSQRLEAIGQLTGGIAHDFNNLLTVIMGNSDTLARGLKDNENLRKRAELSLEAARRAAELTSQLLAFARRQTLAPKAVDANRLVRELHELMQRSLGAQIEIDFSAGPGLWLCKIDSTQLETALLNLALNARDAMPGGGRLTIAASNRSISADGQGSVGDLAAGDYVAIAVSDTGTGMAPDVLARAFEPFFTTKDIGKGSGLGLAMVYGFVKQSGGHAAIESQLGQGTTVTLYLPRAKEDVAAKVPATPADGAPLPGGRETILVVEDDAAVRELVTDQLRNLGYRVLVAGNGPTARNILYGGEKVDLLFTDVLMPGGMTGIQLAEEAERQIPGLKVLFTTGFADVPALKQSRGGVSLLRKPYKSRDLASTVRQALDNAA